MTVRTGSFRIGSEAIAGTFTRAAPSASITGPSASISTTGVTITWTYSSPITRAQAQFRVRLKSPDGSVTFFDSGFVAGSGLTYSPAYLLNDQSTYMAVVNVSDGFDASTDVTSLFTVSLADPNSYPDADVGSVFEVGINGTGYMLADTPGTEFQYRRQTVPLYAQRYATGSTPFSEAIDRYSFVSWFDWREGAGQHYKSRDSSTSASFYDSEGIDPFADSTLRLLNTTASSLSSAYTNPLAVVVNNKLYVLTGAKQLTEVATIGGTTTAFSVAAATTIVAMATDGVNHYSADGANIFKGASNTDPGAAWSTIDAQVMAWAGDRLCVGYATSPSTTPNTFSTLTTAGTEDVPTGRLILQPGSIITSICGGDGYVWFAVKRGQQGLVYAWQAGSSNAPFIAFEFPTGQAPVALGFYLSNVFVRCAETLAAGGARASIYRAATSTGRLIPTLVNQIESGTDDHTVGSWAGNGLYALFSWKKVTAAGASGVGCIDLATGGYARWVFAPSSAVNGDVTTVLSWNGKVVLCIAGSGVYVETSSPLATGNLRTDIADLASPIAKVFGEMKLEASPLPTGGGVQVEYTLDGGASYALTAFSLTGAGATVLSGLVDKQAQSLGLRLTLTAALVSPVLRTVTVRSHPYGLADVELQLPINCADRLDGLNGQELPGGGRRSGALRARVLEQLAQTRVKFQDVDWDAGNPTSTIWEVQAVDVRSMGVFDRHVNRQSQTQIAIVTLRRTLK